MDITQRKEGDVLIVELSGRMTIGYGEAEAGDAILTVVKSGETKILLDMGDVPLVDSSFIGELISAYTAANNRGSAIKLLNLSPRVEEVMKSTMLTSVFDIFDDETVAIASFA